MGLRSQGPEPSQAESSIMTLPASPELEDPSDGLDQQGICENGETGRTEERRGGGLVRGGAWVCAWVLAWVLACMSACV